MDDEEQKDDFMGGGFGSEDDMDLPLDEDLDLDPEDLGGLKLDEEEEDPDNKFH